MPIYKMDGKKDGLQKYRVRINYIDREGKSRQLDRVAYGKDAAKDLERQLTLDLKTGDATASHMTVQQLFDEYIVVKAAETRETSLATLKKHLTKYVMPYIGDIRIDKLNAKSLQNWKSKVDEYITRNGKGLAVNSKQNIYTDLGSMLKYAVRMEYIPKNPLPLVGNFKDVYLEAETTNIDFYTADEFHKYIAEALKRAEACRVDISEWNYYVFFNIAFYTGMRKGEINALRWTDIEGDIIHIRRSINQKLVGEDRETPPKNKSSIRDIQCPIPLLNILNQHLERYKAINGFNTSWRICGGPQCLRDSTIAKRNADYAKAANVKQIRIHDFRHTHASLLANSGINIQEIARRLGHTNVEITWNTYSHLYPKEEQRAVSVLNNV